LETFGPEKNKRIAIRFQLSVFFENQMKNAQKPLHTLRLRNSFAIE